MSESLRIILGAYLSTSMSSLVMNTYMVQKTHYKQKKESIRNLRYKKGLCAEAKQEIKNIDTENFYELMDCIKNAFIPIKNVFFTISLFEFDDEMQEITKDVYDRIVERTNIIEGVTRYNNIRMLKSIREELTSIPNGIDLDKVKSISERDTKRILRLNNLDYNKEMKIFEEKDNM